MGLCLSYILALPFFRWFADLCLRVGIVEIIGCIFLRQMVHAWIHSVGFVLIDLYILRLEAFCIVGPLHGLACFFLFRRVILVYVSVFWRSLRNAWAWSDVVFETFTLFVCFSYFGLSFRACMLAYCLFGLCRLV